MYSANDETKKVFVEDLVLHLTLYKETSMTVKSFILNGQEYSGTFNGNHELSKSVSGLDDKVLIEWPRARNCSNGVPVIKIDGNIEIRLGFHFFNEEEKEMYKNYKKGLNTGSGSGSSAPKISVKAQDLDKYAREVLANEEVVKKLSPEALTFFKLCLLEDQKIVAAVKALVNAGLDEETARSVLKAQGVIKE